MTDPARLDSIVHAFEQAWQHSRNSYPKISDYMPTESEGATRRDLIVELVCIDLEFRWKNAGMSALSLEQYVPFFDGVHSLDALPLEIVVEEYRARQTWGDRPSHCTFLKRFACRKTQIADAMHGVDRDLDNEAIKRMQTTPRNFVSNQIATTNNESLLNKASLNYADFLLQEMIGIGRTGKVYRAWDRRNSQPVAVKYLRKSFQSNSDVVDRFINEAIIVSQFQHPHIVKTEGLGQTPGGGYFIVMELIDMPDLSITIKQESVSISDAVEWMMQLCQALEYAHTQGVIHCDLKPANLLIDESGKLHVTDFGLSRSLHTDQPEFGQIEGTAAYMASEQVSTWWGIISPQTDIYGIGAVFYNLLTGRPPYQGDTLADILAQVVSGVAVIPPIKLRPELTPRLNDLCIRCLSKHPKDRFNDVEQLHDELQNAITEH